MSPMRSRTARPALPLALEDTSGTATPTSTYEASASAPSTGDWKPTNAVMPTDTMSAMSAGERVWA